MGIFPVSSEQLNLLDIGRRFSPFSNEACKLPVCYVHFYTREDFAAASAQFSAFSAYIAKCERGETISGELSVNEFGFSPLTDGIALRDDEPVFIWLHNAYRRMEVVLPAGFATPHRMEHLAMRAYQYTAVMSDFFLLHAAAVEYCGAGIAFCGISGAGKSTQARLWSRTYGASAINNDQPCVFFDNGSAFLHGTPWSGKEPCYRNEYFPLRAIVFVEQSTTERVERLSAAEAFSLLYLNNRMLPIYPAPEAAYTALAERLATSVPVYRQFCSATELAPHTLRQALFGKD